MKSSTRNKTPIGARAAVVAAVFLLGACSSTTASKKDPIEGFNRAMFSVNETIDRYALKPVATVYDDYLPKAIKTGVSNFFGGALSKGSLTFVSKAGFNADLAQLYGLKKTLSAVKGIRGIGKRHMVHNDYLPKMEVDAQTYQVRADGKLLTCEPATSLPMTQRYFLF